MQYKKTIGRLRQKTQKYFTKYPLRFFYGALGLFIMFIILGSFLRSSNKVEEEPKPLTKHVAVYSVGTSPKISVSGKVEKSGVIEIVALTSGVVQKINYREGSTVKKGSTLINISSNYQGGNSFSIQRQLADVQNQNTLDTYQTQKEIIQKQKDLAEKQQDNTEELKSITEKSLDETKNLISLNDSIVDSLNSNLDTLELDPVTNADVILSTKQIKSQFVAAQGQARNALRQAEYQVDDDNPPTDLSNIQKDLTIKQLDVQMKMLDMNKEISRLQLQLAYVAEAMTAPSAPFSGVIERVFVKEGQVVNPGTPLARITQRKEDDPITVIVYVRKSIAQNISKTEPADITIGSKVVQITPSYISTEPVRDDLCAVYFPIPDEYGDKLSDNSYVNVDLSIGYQDTLASSPYVPLDAVHQTQSKAFVFVTDKDEKVAKAYEVKLGEVFGSLIEIQGLKGSQLIILDRTVTDGSPIAVIK